MLKKMQSKTKTTPFSLFVVVDYQTVNSHLPRIAQDHQVNSNVAAWPSWSPGPVMMQQLGYLYHQLPLFSAKQREVKQERGGTQLELVLEMPRNEGPNEMKNG